MPDSSPILSLPLIQVAQAQKHVTHNEALRILDILVQLSVLTADTISPPPAAVEGDRHIVPVGATGDWAGQDRTISWLQDGVWQFIAPQSGWRADVTATAQQLRFDGSQWVDATNKLAVAADASLLSHNGTSHQLKINKAAMGDTASLLFQSNWSGRAEFGLTGDDDFHVKTSADGSIWNDAIVATGAGDVGIGKTPAAKLDVDGIMRLTPTPSASLPTAASIGAGGIAFVSDAVGGAQLAYCDGASWLKISDGTAI